MDAKFVEFNLECIFVINKVIEFHFMTLQYPEGEYIEHLSVFIVSYYDQGKYFRESGIIL